MNRFFRPSHEAIAGVIGVVALGLVVNAALLVSCLPLVLLLVTTDPMRSWPLLAGAAVLAAPGIAAAFRAFREHATGGRSALRAFGAGLRDTWRRALAVGAIGVAVLVVLLVDVAALSPTPVSVVVVPLLWLLVALTASTLLVALVLVSEVPDVRIRNVLRASVWFAVRKWPFSIASLAAVAVQAAVFTSAPALGLGITASAVLYVVWANGRHVARDVMAVETVDATA